MKKPPAKRSTQGSQQPPQTQTRIEVSRMWQGPLPPPEALAEFNHVVHDGAERIMRAWEQETEHRRAIEKTEQRKYYSDLLTGKILAFLFVIAALGVSAFAAYVGAEWVAAIIGGGTIGSVVWAFIRGSKPE